MIAELKTYFNKLISPPTPMEKASKELIEAKNRLLEAQTALEWAKTTVEYNNTRIKRLTEYVANEQLALASTRTRRTK